MRKIKLQIEAQVEDDWLGDVGYDSLSKVDISSALNLGDRGLVTKVTKVSDSGRRMMNRDPWWKDPWEVAARLGIVGAAIFLYLVLRDYA